MRLEIETSVWIKFTVLINLNFIMYDCLIIQLYYHLCLYANLVIKVSLQLIAKTAESCCLLSALAMLVLVLLLKRNETESLWFLL